MVQPSSLEHRRSPRSQQRDNPNPKSVNKSVSAEKNNQIRARYEYKLLSRHQAPFSLSFDDAHVQLQYSSQLHARRKAYQHAVPIKHDSREFSEAI